MEDTINFLKENIKDEPKTILDIGCGYSPEASYLLSAFPDSTVYCLDKNREALSIGISLGRFYGAIPVHGDANNLGKKNNGFTSVHLDSRYSGGESVKWEKLEHRKLEESLEDFDLVIAINPVDKIPNNLFYLYQTGKLKLEPLPLTAISAAARKGGHVLYQEEIANGKGVNYSLTPSQINEKNIERSLERILNRKGNSNLELVSHSVIHKNNQGFSVIDHTKDIAVLFKKT